MAKKQTIPAAEVALFCEQVAMLLQAGIPLYDGMDTLSETYGGAFETLSRTVLETGSLGAAVEASGMFPQYCIGMIHIAEQTGNLEVVLQSLASYYYREDKLRAAIKSALLYPAVLVVMMAAVIGVLVIKVLPIFNQVFRSLGADLTPAATAMMEFGISGGRVLLIVVGVLLLLIVGVAIWAKCGGAQRLLQFGSKVFPPVRRLRREITAERFAGVVSMMLASGYPVGSALKMAADIAPDAHAAKAIHACAARVDDGKGFAEAIEEVDIFAPLEEKMIRTAGIAGRTDQVLDQLAKRYEEQLDSSISSMVSLIEPALVAVMAVGIGGILLSIMLPLLGILSAIGG